jgi:2-polyprenyl-3-methyl-5-hydroxy-6-metoxy-1,4-benzoquinol methylase
MPIFTTEITSDKITSDNPIHQRHTKAYIAAVEYVKGDLLEVGCGQGRGISIMVPHVKKYVALERHQNIVDELGKKYPQVDIRQAVVPPLEVPDDAFDTVISFQVIEHINDDRAFLKEIYRSLKPGGKALITTPNIKMSLTRNPWHVREYTAEQLQELASGIFSKVVAKGIHGNEKAMSYYEMNKRSVRKFTRIDIFNLQYRLPAWMLRIPYDILNRLNRNRLKEADNELVRSFTPDDWVVTDTPDQSIDLFYILEK